MSRTDKSRSLGQRIKRIREQKGVSLEALANETGYSIEYLKEVEGDQVIPPVAALLSLGRAMKLESGALLKDDQEELAAAERRAEAVKKRTDHYSYQVLTPEALDRHLKAFLITIDPHSAHKGAAYQHEGEEFHYVLKGSVQVTVGDNVNDLSAGDSLHFNSALVHNLRNTGEETAELLVVLYTP